MGIPAIVSEATNIRSVVKKYNSGFGLKDLKPETVAGRLKEMETLTNTERYQEMRQNAFKMVKEEFDWEIIANRFYQEYNLLIEK